MAINTAGFCLGFVFWFSSFFFFNLHWLQVNIKAKITLPLNNSKANSLGVERSCCMKSQEMKGLLMLLFTSKVN